MSTRTLDLAIAALQNSHADLLAREEQRIAASKGKAKATQADDTRDAEYRRQLEEHSSALDELLATREKQNQDGEAKASETGVSEPLHHKFGDRKVAKSSQDATDKDPYLNPFTGSYVFPETGFEPGSSSTIQIRDCDNDFSVPPPAYSFEDKLDSPILDDSNHQIPVQDDHTTGEVGYTELKDDHVRQEVGDGDSKENSGKMSVKPFIFRGFGSMVAAFESWVTPKINTALHVSSFLSKVDSASQNHGRLPDECLRETKDNSVTIYSSHGTSYAGISSTEMLQSTSTLPSSNYSKRSRLSKRPMNYHPNFPSIQDRDEGPPISSSRDLNRTIVQSPEIFHAISAAPQPGDIDAPPPLVEAQNSEFIKGKTAETTNIFSENVADISFLEDVDKVAQMQRDRELADQEAAAEAQKSYEKLVQMQREFDEECTRLRADREMALAYARDMEEAMRVDEKLRGEEAILLQDLELAQKLESQFLKEEDRRQQDLEAAAKFARNLEEVDSVMDADTAFAARLMQEEETALQNDRAFAERLQADVEQEEANAAKFYHPNSNEDLNRTYAGELDSQPLPYVRFPLPENIRGSARVSRNDTLKANNKQKPEVTASSDRTFAQALLAKEQMRYAEANERWKRDIQAWSETNKTKAEAGADGYAQPEKVQTGARHMPTRRPEVIAARMSIEKDVADCTLCVESFPKSQLVRPCKDFYCRPCLAEWFQRALNEKPKNQPRCCNQILPVSLVSRQLGAVFMASWRLFELEITTPNPLYCSNRKCAKFIAPYDIHGDTGSCSCATQTCRHCRNRSHPGKLCAQDEDTQKVRALGKKEGWRYCPKCKHLIERTEGCLHMVCSQCRTEFCWKCGKTTCKGVGACKGGMEYYQ